MRRIFTLDFKAEVVWCKKAEDLSSIMCDEKFSVRRKLAQR